MKLNLYNKYRIKTVKTGLILTENKIELITNTLTKSKDERKKIENELEKEYVNYAHYAHEYIHRKVKLFDNMNFIQRRLVFEAWKQMVEMLDKIYLKEGVDTDGYK